MIAYIYFYHDRGPIIVADRAAGPRNSQSALVWHLRPEEEPLPGQTWRLRLHMNGEPVEAVFVPIVDDGQSPGFLSFAPEGDNDLKATYTSSTPGQLRVATVFLPGDWVGADVGLVGSTTQPMLRLVRDGAELQVPLYR